MVKELPLFDCEDCNPKIDYIGFDGGRDGTKSMNLSIQQKVEVIPVLEPVVSVLELLSVSLR